MKTTNKKFVIYGFGAVVASTTVAFVIACSTPSAPSAPSTQNESKI